MSIVADGALIVNLISGIFFVVIVMVRRQRMNLDQITISIVQEAAAAVFAVAVGVQGLQELIVAFAMRRGRHMH